MAKCPQSITGIHRVSLITFLVCYTNCPTTLLPVLQIWHLQSEPEHHQAGVLQAEEESKAGVKVR